MLDEIKRGKAQSLYEEKCIKRRARFCKFMTFFCYVVAWSSVTSCCSRLLGSVRAKKASVVPEIWHNKSVTFYKLSFTYKLEV